jgi:hypothetical protein
LDEPWFAVIRYFINLFGNFRGFCYSRTNMLVKVVGGYPLTTFLFVVKVRFTILIYLRSSNRLLDRLNNRSLCLCLSRSFR